MDEQNLTVDKICGIAREKQCRPTQTSAGVPHRPSGVRLITLSEKPGCALTSAVRSVAMKPGPTPFTRIPLSPNSHASTRTRPVSPVFAEQ